MNDDSFGDSIIVRGQREKSKKREKRIEEKITIRERLSMTKYFIFIHIYGFSFYKVSNTARES